MEQGTVPEFAVEREWLWRVEMTFEGSTAILSNGTFTSSSDLVEMKLSGVKSLPTWKRFGNKRDADGALLGLRLIGVQKGVLYTAIAQRVS